MWREVEEAGPLAHGAVLLEDAGVLDRHLPAAEVDDPGPERLVPLVERRASRGPSVIDRASPARRESVRARRRRDAAARCDERPLGLEGEQGLRLARTDPAHLLELVVVAGEVAAGRLHQEVVHRLVDARPPRTNGSRSQPSGARMRTCRPVSSAHLAQGRLLEGLARRPGCPWAATRSPRRARAGGGPTTGRGTRSIDRRTSRRPRWRGRASAAPRRRGGARAARRAGARRSGRPARRGCVQRDRGRPDRGARRSSRADGAPAARRATSGAEVGSRQRRRRAPPRDARRCRSGARGRGGARAARGRRANEARRRAGRGSRATLRCMARW